jgi:hypothetical protein
MNRGWAWLVVAAAFAVVVAAKVDATPVRAAYFYHYMGAAHLDDLASHGFARAVIHWIPDSLGLAGARELDAFAARGHELNVQVVPQWALQNESRLAARPASRRYVWGRQSAEPDVPCPNDSLYWRSALLDRADEFLGGRPGLTAVALDLELYRGHRHRYDAGPCRCDSCLAEFYAGRTPSDRAAPSDPDLMGWEESHLQRVLTGILREFAARHPGIEIAVFDLDFSSFVHRALGRALAASGVPTSDYCEASYAAAGDALPAARAALDALGLQRAPLIGGLWLKCFSPRAIGGAVRSVETKGQGYFIFTTYSLWHNPLRLQGPYTLPASQAEYWSAIAEANRP